MLRFMCKSKIHRARVLKTELHYKGSIGLDRSILEAADIFENEKVQVLNINNGERFETYAIAEPDNSGNVILYGPAARLGMEGDELIIISYCLSDSKEALHVKTKVIKLDKNNKILQ